MVQPRPDASRVVTVPNLLSMTRIALVPVFVALILRDGAEVVGLVLFGVVASTDWIDGYVARRTGHVTELGKIIDPVADRLAIGGALVAVVIRDAFPLWAAAAIIVRDALVLVAGLAVLFARGVRIDVRRSGKVATFLLMLGVPCIAWAGFDLPFAPLFELVGWAAYGTGISLYYWTTVRYADDVRRAWSGMRSVSEEPSSDR